MSLKFRKHQQGVISIEFALLLPVLLLISMATIELGLVAFAQVVLEGAINSGARLAKTGHSVSGQSREEVIAAEVKRLSRSLMDENALEITTTAYRDFNFTDPTKKTNNSVGGPGDMVVIEAKYNWDIVTPLVSEFFPDPYPVKARVAVRNEPF